MADDNLLSDPPADPSAVDSAPPANDPPPADPPANDPPADPAPSDDWRAGLVGEDKALLGYLGRYQSAKAFVEAAKKDRDTARQRQSARLPDNPTDEELAAYRKDNGIPEKPEGYLENLPDGLVVGDDDKPFVGMFLEKMHGVNAHKPTVDAALEAYYGIVEEQLAKERETDALAKQESTDLLREEWGGDYRRNINAVKGFLDTLPEAVSSAIQGGKGPDGISLGNNAEFVKWLTSLSLEANPLATIVPGAGANQSQAVSDEIAEIEKVMREDRPRYNKDEKMQARYRELLDAQLKLKAA